MSFHVLARKRRLFGLAGYSHDDSKPMGLALSRLAISSSICSYVLVVVRDLLTLLPFEKGPGKLLVPW
jgi:hypothetical protein